METSKLIKQINVRVSSEVHERLSSISRERDLKIADIVREAIRNFFETSYADQE
jgi:predicted DNA-binding protein